MLHVIRSKNASGFNIYSKDSLFAIFCRVGWEHAVATWMRFQSHLHLSNGLVALIRHCIHTQHEPNTHDNLQYGGEFDILKC